MRRHLLVFLLLTAASIAGHSGLHATTPETALSDYIHNGDTSFQWTVIDSTQVADVTAYRLLLRSQTWRGIPWMHEMVVVVPRRVKHSEALLHLTGGGEDEQTSEIRYHDWNDGTIQAVGQMAHNCQAVTAIVWQVPRQPLFGGKVEDVANPQGKALVEMVDPYSYRRQLTQPKMLFMGTNDEFWTVDAVKHYIDSIPGPHMMTYVPNAGHGLGDRQAALLSLEAFFAQTIRGGRYVTCQSAITLNGKKADLFVQTTGKGRLLNVELWEATSQTLDFRKARFAPVMQMQTRDKAFHIDVTLPEYAYKAFFVMLTYKHPVEQRPYTICTRMYTADAERVRL